ncbi:PREDICTED: uncharacterized protein LOC109243894 [Nicotiana attenuata]|uniref:Uncharacterized protein n=1 Tax=Nicotiana attenuata TaxID=49451 RepID=A0A314L1Z8_NICAT|nr:PREDICTED: uncharacterized protein LOC109243894 [Nicotiana attenuata]OIT35039.1 hypothetical protein A4A49_06094 [Nicotiana attenuata]
MLQFVMWYTTIFLANIHLMTVAWDLLNMVTHIRVYSSTGNLNSEMMEYLQGQICSRKRIYSLDGGRAQNAWDNLARTWSKAEKDAVALALDGTWSKAEKDAVALALDGWAIMCAPKICRTAQSI